MNKKEILEALLSAINGIDGGCSTCIRAFVNAANKDLEKIKSHYRFSMDVERDDDNIVPLEDTP